MKSKYLSSVVLPVVGMAVVLLLWEVFTHVFKTSLPGPLRTWEVSKLYVLEPFTKRGDTTRAAAPGRSCPRCGARF